MSTAIPTIVECVSLFKGGERTASRGLNLLGLHYIRPLVREDGTVDRKSAPFLEVRKNTEAALVDDYARHARDADGIAVSLEAGYTVDRIRDLFALSKSVMKKLAKTDADWIVATAVKNAVRRDWNRIVQAGLPEAPAADGEDGADAAPGAGTAASDKAAKADAAPLSDADILAAVQNFVAAAPDASAAGTFLQSIDALVKRLRGDLKAGRKVLPCEA